MISKSGTGCCERCVTDVCHNWPGYRKRCVIVGQGVAGGAPSLVSVWQEVGHIWPSCGSRSALVMQGMAGGTPHLTRVWQEVRHI